MKLVKMEKKHKKKKGFDMAYPDAISFLRRGLTSPYCLQEEGLWVSPHRARCCSGQHPTVLSLQLWGDFGSEASKDVHYQQAPLLPSTFGPELNKNVLKQRQMTNLKATMLNLLFRV